MTFLRLLYGASVALAAASAAFAADAPGRGALITKPATWAARASDAQMASAYPQSAKGVGFANLGCILGAGGVLTQCRVVGEAPQGYGFGAAALVLAPSFRARYSAGEEGASVLLPLEFDPAGPKPPVNPIDCLAPLCVLEIAPGAPTPAQP
jgi:hypothetical protein